MPFAPDKLDGSRDPNINRNGRPKLGLTNREMRENALASIGRKLTPNVKNSVQVLLELMNDKSIKAEVRSKIALEIIALQMKTIDALHGKIEPVAEAEAVKTEPMGAVVSFTVVPKAGEVVKPTSTSEKSV